MWPALLAVSLVLVGITGLPKVIINAYFFSIYILAFIAGISSIFVNIIRNILNDDFDSNNIKKLSLYFFNGFVICIIVQTMVIPYLKDFIIYISNNYLLVIFGYVIILIESITTLISFFFTHLIKSNVPEYIGDNPTKLKKIKTFKNLKIPTAFYMGPKSSPTGNEVPRGRSRSYDFTFLDENGQRRFGENFSINMNPDPATNTNRYTLTRRSDINRSRVTGNVSTNVSSNTNTNTNVSTNTSSNTNVNTDVTNSSQSTNSDANTNTNVATTNTNVTTRVLEDETNRGKRRKIDHVTDVNTNVSNLPFASSSNATNLPFASSSNATNLPNASNVTNSNDFFNFNLYNRFIDNNNVIQMNNLQERRIQVLNNTLINNRADLTALQDRIAEKLEIFYGNFSEFTITFASLMSDTDWLNTVQRENYVFAINLYNGIILQNRVENVFTIAEIDPAVSSFNNTDINLSTTSGNILTLSPELYKILYEVILHYEYIEYFNDIFRSINNVIRILEHQLANPYATLDLEYINQVLRTTQVVTVINDNPMFIATDNMNPEQIRLILDTLKIYNEEIETAIRRIIMDLRGPGSIFGQFDSNRNADNIPRLADILRIYYNKSGLLYLYNSPVHVNILKDMSDDIDD